MRQILGVIIAGLCVSLARGEICLVCNCVFVNVTKIEPKQGEMITFQYKAEITEPFNVNTTYDALEKYFYVDCSSEKNVGQIKNLDWPKLKVLGIIGNFRNSKWKKLESFPGVIKTKMSVLSLSDNLITEIDDYEMDDFMNLKMLNLTQNQIRVIKKGAFAKINHLRIMDLSRNWLTEIEDWAFYGTDLQYLNLSNNAITHLTPDIFRGLNNLTVLDLSGNRLTKLPDEFGNFLPSLNWLSVRRNSFQRLPELPKDLKKFDVSFNELIDLHLSHVNLEILDVGHNELRSLAHTNFPLLRVLRAGYNNLTELSTLQSGQIRILDISYNKFDRIPEVVTSDKLPFLEELYLDGNLIANVSFPTQSEPFSDLRVVSLSYLKFLKKIHKNSFEGHKTWITRTRDFFGFELSTENPLYERNFGVLPVPRWLPLPKCENGGFRIFPRIHYDCSKESGIWVNLSHSSIKFVDEDAFREIFVCKVDLSNNNLKRLSKELLPWMRMSYVNLQENPWQCDCNIQWMLDEFLVFMYQNNPRLLFNLRCATPLRYKNKQFAFWYNKSENVFCNSGPSSLYIDLAGGKKVEIWTASAITCVVLGCIILVTGIVILVLICTKPSKKKKTQRKSDSKGPPYYKQIPNNEENKSQTYGEKSV